MYPWTLCESMPQCRLKRCRNRAVSSTVPEPITRPRSHPVRRKATWVSTSTGLVTTSITADEPAAAMSPAIWRTIEAFLWSKSSRVSPGRCAVPAVMTITRASA